MDISSFKISWEPHVGPPNQGSNANAMRCGDIAFEHLVSFQPKGIYDCTELLLIQSPVLIIWT